MCYDNGGIIDDLLIYRYNDYYMLVVNAANIEKDFNWLNEHLLDYVTLENHSDEISLIALQGPKSREILSNISESEITDLPFYYFIEGKVAGCDVTIARTGYTGELGFEIYGKNEDIPKVWDTLFNIGKPMGLVPAGLAARDTLRLEMKFCLYGNDIDKTTHPYEAGLGWITKVDKGDFIGRNAIIDRKANMTRRLVCVEMLDKAIPRHNYDIYINDEKIGYFTSGGQSPSLQKGIGLAYINRPHIKSGTEIEIEIRGKRKKAVIVKPPFYKDGTFDTNFIINPDGTFRGTPATGQLLFDNGIGGGSSCSLCHGTDGLTEVVAGFTAFPGFLSNDNPQEFAHKVFFGHPGSAMVITYDFGATLQNVADLSAWCQILPQN